MPAPDVTAASSASPVPTFADRLQQLRRERFVGRDSECAHFARLLAGDAPPVWLLHGPGGVGKTTLLQRLAQLADSQGRVVLQLDARQLAATPAGWRQALHSGLQLPAAEALPAGLVLVVDGFEAIAALEGWLRDEELPRFPADARVVLAGRTPPDTRWQIDPGWQGLAQVSQLDPWSADEARAYWQARLPDLPPDEAALTQARGHPLLLALLTEVRRRGATAPDRVGDRVTLLQGVLQQLAGVAWAHPAAHPAEQRALDVLMVARVVNETLLADCTGSPDPAGLLRMLARLPFVEQVEHGLRVHDLVRECFAASWLGREPGIAPALREAILRHLARRVPSLQGDSATHYLKDWFFVLGQTDSAPHIDYRHFETHYHDSLRRAEDQAAVQALTAARFGPTVQAAVAHWLACRPQGFVLTRRRDGSVAGFALLLELADLPDSLLAADPPAAALARWVRGQRRLQGSALLARLCVDAAGDALPNPSITLGGMHMNVRTLLRPDAEWTLLVHHNHREMAAMFGTFTRFNWHREDPALGFTQDGQRFGVFVRDLLAEPVPADWRPARLDGSQGLLDETAFRSALNQAWRDVHRDDRLAANPLLAHTRSMADAAQLRAALQAAVQALTLRPQDLKFHHALRLTWLDPGGTQEQVADELGLPFNTYRYHLAKGAERAASWLWLHEVRARQARPGGSGTIAGPEAPDAAEAPPPP